MKTGKLLGMLLFVLGTFSLMGCNDEMTDEEEGWYDSIPDGNFFSTLIPQHYNLTLFISS